MSPVRAWSSCFAGILSLEQPVNIPLQDGVIIVVGEEGASEVGSFGEARDPAEVGEEELVVWSRWMESRGMVSGLSRCPSNQQ